MATAESLALADSASMPALAARVAELEAMVARLVDVHAGLVEAVARLAPAGPVPLPTRPPLRLVQGGAR
jgi:NADPH-dependent ferric siderophore reductase